MAASLHLSEKYYKKMSNTSPLVFISWLPNLACSLSIRQEHIVPISRALSTHLKSIALQLCRIAAPEGMLAHLPLPTQTTTPPLSLTQTKNQPSPPHQ